MKISIVIPLYNKEDFIGRALASVIAQTYGDWECIIVDDGSSDRSLDVVSGFQDQRIKIVRQQNAGPSAARNRGAKEAHGEWIALLDADDYWLNDHLSVLTDLIVCFPECNVVASNWWNEDMEGNRTVANKFSTQNDTTIEEYIEFVAGGFGPLVHSSSAAVRKSAWVTVGGFRNQFRLAEDADFWCRLSLQTRFAVSHRPSSVYFQDLTGNSTRSCLYVGDAPFIDLRRKIPTHRRKSFEKYLAIWRVNSLALGTLLSGQKRLTRKMSMESFRHTARSKALALLLLSLLPTELCRKLYASFRRIKGCSPISSFISVRR